jgi:phage shock protein PspC (stress-responsive transcriptional regulator)
MEKKLYRLRNDRVLAGVASGLARHFNTDPVLIRVLFIAVALAGGSGVLAYIIMWAIVPEEPYQFQAFGDAGANPTANPASEDQKPAETNSDARQGRIIAGGVLILLGALFLAEEFLPSFDFSKFWPLLLIGIGVLLLLNSKSKSN